MILVHFALLSIMMFSVINICPSVLKNRRVVFIMNVKPGNLPDVMPAGMVCFVCILLYIHHESISILTISMFMTLSQNSIVLKFEMQAPGKPCCALLNY
jgi:hypothetical protein